MTQRIALAFVMLVAPASAQDTDIEAGAGLWSPPPLTLDGRPLSPVFEVWSLQEPAVEPDAETDEPAAAAFAARHPILTGAVFGAVGGCIYGAAIGSTTSDLKASDFCAANALVFSGIVAGTVAFARWYRDAAP